MFVWSETCARDSGSRGGMHTGRPICSACAAPFLHTPEHPPEEQPPEEQPAQPANDDTGLAPLVPPSPESGAEENGNGHAHGIPSKADILHKLDQMPGLIAIGLLPPAKANAMKGVYNTILNHVGDSPQSSAARVADEDLIKILRQQPELLKALQPFLTPEQRELIIREAPK